jgi:hypothetical protein
MISAKEASRRCRSPNLRSDPLSPSLGIAIPARGRDLRAAPPWVKRVVRPLDSRILSHPAPTAGRTRASVLYRPLQSYSRHRESSVAPSVNPAGQAPWLGFAKVRYPSLDLSYLHPRCAGCNRPQPGGLTTRHLQSFEPPFLGSYTNLQNNLCERKQI